MKAALTLLTLLFSQRVVSTTAGGCHEDNCFRGVAGVNGEPARSQRLGDCENLFPNAVTLAPVTTTVTVNVTLAPTAGSRTLAARQISALVPAYATYCPDFSAYQSACSCAGIIKGSTTVPVTTVTKTVTATIAPTLSCPGQTICPNGCADLTQDNKNCGSCNNSCKLPFVCGQSKCILPAIYSCSPTDYHACGGTCGGACFRDVIGGGWCKKPLPCAGLKGCTTGANCDSTICLVNNCGKVCAGTPFLCDDTTKASFLFAKRDMDGDSFRGRLEGRGLIETELGPVEG